MKTETNQNWDYSNQAQYYKYRPNYDEKAIDELCLWVGANKNDPDYLTADVGAGTGNLTIMLLQRGLKCLAIEPNQNMRAIGIERTSGQNVSWQEGTGENSTLANNSVNWFVMGSSFNTTDRSLTLREAHRALKPEGYFSCMWNHRDLENDPVQEEIEKIILSIVPNYERGVRREGQADFILTSGLFNDIHYIEKTQSVERTVDEYIKAWMSVKNKFWDFDTDEGRETFNKIAEKITEQFGKLGAFNLNYTTKIWTAKVIK